MWHNREHISGFIRRDINKSINQSYGNKRAESTQAQCFYVPKRPMGNDCVARVVNKSPNKYPVSFVILNANKNKWMGHSLFFLLNDPQQTLCKLTFLARVFEVGSCKTKLRYFLKCGLKMLLKVEFLLSILLTTNNAIYLQGFPIYIAITKIFV